MSSILDALRKVEAAQAVPGQTVAVWTPPRPRSARRTLIAVGLAFAAGAALTFWLRTAGPPAPGPIAASPPEPAPIVVTPPIARPAAAAPVAAVEAPAPAVPASAPPRAQVASLPAAPPVEAPPPPATIVPRPSARVDGSPRRTAAHAPPRVPEPPPPVAPADAPPVHVSFLVYSKVPARRTVALTIDGGRLVTLHEGESAHDVEVERIRPDGVDLRWAGRSFALRAGN